MSGSREVLPSSAPEAGIARASSASDYAAMAVTRGPVGPPGDHVPPAYRCATTGEHLPLIVPSDKTMLLEVDPFRVCPA